MNNSRLTLVGIDTMKDKNSPNKTWWDKNPMTYVEGKAKVNWNEKKRFIDDSDQFGKLNQDYLDTNPYLNNLFKDDKFKCLLKGKHILDIGTGWGSSALLLESCECKVTAIDLSDSSIEGAKNNNKLFGKGNIKIMAMDAESLEFPDETFDFIYSWGVIHHSNSTETIVEEISRVLKHGGQGLIMVYNRYSTRYYLLGLWHLFIKGKILKGESMRSVQDYFTDGYWHRHFTPKELSQILKENELIVDRIEPTYMARRILPGIKEGSVLDNWLKKKLGWLLVARFSKMS